MVARIQVRSDKVRARFAALPDAIRAAAEPAVAKSAEELGAFIRLRAPVDQGDLRDSITVTHAGQSTPAYSHPGGAMVVPELAAVVTAGNSDVRYAHIVEYGSTKAPAQPYFWVSVRLLQKRMARRIKTAVGKAVRTARGIKPRIRQPRAPS